MALVAAAVTFVCVFWTVWELGQPWIQHGMPARIGG